MRRPASRGAALVLALGILVAACDQDPTVPDAERITDAGFKERANALCRQYGEDELQGREEPEQTDSLAERARDVDEVASIYDRLVADLREVPVADADAGAVEKWLETWETFNDIGHDFAVAIRSNDEREFVDQGISGADEIAQVRAFARANGLDACLY